MAERFFIDPDIRSAKALEARFYTDPSFFERSKEQIFARTWQFAAGPELDAGLTPISILPGFLDEPVVISQMGGSRKCFSNVCTHRGKILVEEACTQNLIRCRYHGRRYSLDGRFLSMPEFDEVTDFPSSADDLSRIETDEWAGFTFVSFAPAAELKEFTGPPPGVVVPKRLTGATTYNVNAHWALYCENYLEGFHIPYVHKQLNEIIDYGNYKTETLRYSSIQTGLDADGREAGRYLFIFPNIMFNFYPWGISVNVVEPVAPDRSRVRFLTYVSDESALGSGAGADLHEVELEDEAVVESVQKGIRSRFYERGRYSPAREQGTHHFHRLIAEFMD